ncbi:hypothetical protein EYM_01515 [Ignicoccus islandicus DSM 13165]|uniref:Uncharacterized protein n=1 Tax=Ignicoccus islandicus DSM 13165 TaxID=940295 RepID=A0A0U3FQQ4_9CREN|nr:GntR family transcriptional regulator [Ignicoccus islandicus]ALU12215.1 hypothetical protein EYM_01515 [Ignicoccus islandicus DSM 13165]
MVIWLFFRKKKKQGRRLKHVYIDRLIKLNELVRKLDEEIFELERLKEERKEEYLRALREKEEEKARALEIEIKDLSKKVRDLKTTKNLLEMELRKMEKETSHANAVATLQRIYEVLEDRKAILEGALLPYAERAKSNIENVLIELKGLDMPTPNAQALKEVMIDSTELLKPIDSGLEKELNDAYNNAYWSTPSTQPVALADGAIRKYSFDEVVEKVYEVIRIYHQYGRAHKLSVKKIASHLGITEAEVRKALERLEKEGKIAIRKRG